MPLRPLLLALLALLLGYEGLALGNATPGDTISEVIWELSDRWPVVPLAFGLLMGHFFWPRRQDRG